MNDISKEILQKEDVLQFHFVEGSIPLKVENIIYIETNRHKNIFHTNNETYSIYKKLDELEEALRGYGFVRIHQSFLVNMRYIKKISSYVMYLSTGQELSVPKSRYAAVKEQYLAFKQ